MPVASANGIRLCYEIHGAGPPVLLVAPAATPAAIWLLHQAPALVQAGYQAVTFDNRGTDPSDVPPGPYRIADLAADAAGLITALGIGPCPVVGASLGAMITQELALARPDLVSAAALLGTRARADFFRQTAARAAAARMRDRAPATPAETVAHMSLMLGTVTLGSDRAAADWYTILRHCTLRGAGAAAQYEATVTADRTTALSGIRCRSLVVAFGEDRVTPPAFCREVADAIPECAYLEIPAAGHLGFLENPAAVNTALLDFLGPPRCGSAAVAARAAVTAR
jgi:pimeloyl-ACP methyl ester carboxylesterase